MITGYHAHVCCARFDYNKLTIYDNYLIYKVNVKHFLPISWCKYRYSDWYIWQRHFFHGIASKMFNNTRSVGLLNIVALSGCFFFLLFHFMALGQFCLYFHFSVTFSYRCSYKRSQAR